MINTIIVYTMTVNAASALLHGHRRTVRFTITTAAFVVYTLSPITAVNEIVISGMLSSSLYSASTASKSAA